MCLLLSTIIVCKNIYLYEYVLNCEFNCPKFSTSWKESRHIHSADNNLEFNK